MATSKSKSKVTLKLLIDTKSQRVLFGEAGKDFVDFLFTLLSLPLGTVIRLLSSNGMVGSLGRLYESFENLSDTYMQPNVDKDILLKPSSPNLGGLSTSFLLTKDQTSTTKKVYICSRNSNNQRNGCYYDSYSGSRTNTCKEQHASDDPRATCPSCNNQISIELPYVAPPVEKVKRGGEGEGGFVQGVVTYMIMDDLEVKPMSTISSISILNTFNVKEIDALQERTVSVGINEGLKLLKASLLTKTVLTRVFLGK